MIYQKQLFQIGNFHFKLHHIIVLGVLILAFSTSFLIRSQNAEFGFELNEFDPFFNFRATEYIVENGFSEYFEWHDTKSWYLPEGIDLSSGDYPDVPAIPGRDVSATSQSLLHITTAITYQIFGGNLTLYDFTILFPAVIGSLTVIVIFALVRLFAGTTAGLFASLFFAVSLPILLRGSLGWFKSEPLGIFYGILGLYLFLSGIQSQNKKIIFSKIVLGGFVMTFGMGSWGGIQFFIIPLGLFILVLPFIRKDHKFLIYSIPLFVGTFLLTSLMFERPGPGFVFGLGGILLIVPTIFLIACVFIQKISNKNKIRNGLIFLLSVIVVSSFLIVINEESNFLPIPSFRYLNAVNPFLTTSIALVDSVAEHATTNIHQSFFFHSVLLIFASIGVWLILSKKTIDNKIFVKNDMRIFVLIIGITGVYVSSAFVRLEVFASISLIILGSIGLSILTKEIFKINYSGKKKYLFKIPYVVIIVIFFMIPLTYPAQANWINVLDIPQTILTGGTSHPPSNNWLDTLEWIKVNTSEDAIIASWWDYGYWITTLSERTTLIDNATISTWQIERMAKIFNSDPNQGWKMLQEWNVDYVVIFVSGEKYPTVEENEFLYVLGGGGDESKLPWFMKIAGIPVENYMNPDMRTANTNFYNDTLLGHLIPFTTLGYANVQTQEQFDTWISGSVQISAKDIKYDSENDPLELVYASSSFTDNTIGPMDAVFVYKINKNYAMSIYPIQE